MANFNHLHAYRPPQHHFDRNFNLSKAIRGMQIYRLLTEERPPDGFDCATGEIPEIQKNRENKLYRTARFHPYQRSEEDEKIPFPQKLTRLLTFVPEKQLTSQSTTLQTNDNTFRDENEQKDPSSDETKEKDPKDVKDESQEEDFFNLTDTMNESYRQLFSIYESNDEKEENFKSHNQCQKKETLPSQSASFTLTTKPQNNPFVAAYSESQNSPSFNFNNSNEDFLTSPVSEDFETALNQQKNITNSSFHSDEDATENSSSNESLQLALRLPDTLPDVWHSKNNKFVKRETALSTYKCWKCQRVGHFAEDCTLYLNLPAQSLRDPNQFVLPSEHHETIDKKGNKQIYSSELRKMYNKCQRITQNTKNYKCATCGSQANLAYCLDCDSVYCDNNYHLIDHLIQNPTHNKLYSFKLRRQIRCAKTTCKKQNIYKLWACHDCLLNIFEKHYNIVYATWSRKGLQFIPNAICCDEHFQWHRTNCLYSHSSEHVVERYKLEQKKYDKTLNEYLF